MRTLFVCYYLGMFYSLALSAVYGAEQNDAPVIIRDQPPLKEPYEAVTRLAEAGNADAQFDLGWLAVTKGDWVEAASWFQRSADNGNTNAMFNLGMLIAKGEPKLSFEYLLEAAVQGYDPAMHEIGSRLLHGTKGAVQNQQEGVLWLMRASERGNAMAQHELGRSYSVGEGVEQNLIEAHAWLSLSIHCGFDASNKPRAEVERFMTSEQIAESAKLVHERIGKLDKHKSR